jgi:hypothetical protein
MRRPRRNTRHATPVVAALACALAAFFPTSAAAGTGGIIDGTLTYAAGSEANDISISWFGAWIVEDSATVTAGPGCETQNVKKLVCSVAGVTEVSVDAGGGDDTITNFTFARSVLRGGAGADTIYGGWGADTLEGGGDADQLFGSAGDDRLDGGVGADSLTGGTGTDVAVYASRSAPVSVSTNGGAGDGELGEGDDVQAEGAELGSGSDVFTGDDGPNTALGGAGDDQLDGTGGDDTLEGGEGKDSYTGGAGADVVRSRDSAGERVDCGADVDTALTDPGDATTECEQVDVSTDALPDAGEGGGSTDSAGGGDATGAPGASDLVEGLRVLNPAGALLTITSRGDVPLRVACPADAIGGCRGTVTLWLVDASGKVVATRRRKPKKKKRRAGRRGFSVQPGGTSTIRVRMSRRARRTVRSHRGRIRLRADVRTVAANGAATTTSRTLRVKASRRTAKRPKRK